MNIFITSASKKLIFITVFLFLVSGLAFAQEARFDNNSVQNSITKYPHHEIYAGVGLLNDNQMFSFFGDILGTIFTFGQVVQANEYRVLTPSIGYKYWFNKIIGVGVHFAFDYNSVKVIHRPDNSNYYNTDTVIHKRYFYTVALDATVNYMYKPVCQLYGNIGMGITIINFSNNTVGLKQFPFFNMHISPIGVRVGKKIAGFAEIGWGYKGFINAGISIKL